MISEIFLIVEHKTGPGGHGEPGSPYITLPLVSSYGGPTRFPAFISQGAAEEYLFMNQEELQFEDFQILKMPVAPYKEKA